MSNHPVPPPSYGAVPPSPNKHDDESREPLLATSSRNAIFDQPDPTDIPDDFKYGTTVSDSSLEIRQAFVRKVYSILFVQILSTCVVGGVLRSSSNTIAWLHAHPWSLYVPLFGTLVNLGLLYWKRHSHPINFIFLSTFTLLEAFALGVGTAYYPTAIVLQALLLALAVFLGLTLFTLQSKWDFSGMGPFLLGGLIALLIPSIINIFVPFSRGLDLAIAIGGTILFSGYVVYDTHMISNRLSPDEYIIGAIELYLDFLNLFLYILRLLNDLQER